MSSRARDDEHRAAGGQDCFQLLLWIDFALQVEGGACHSARPFVCSVGRFADLAGDPLIQFRWAESPSTTELECRDFAVRREPIDSALACLQVGGYLVNREDLVRLIVHLVTCSQFNKWLATGVACHNRARLCEFGQTWHEKRCCLPRRTQVATWSREMNQSIARATVTSNYKTICEKNRQRY